MIKNSDEIIDALFDHPCGEDEFKRFYRRSFECIGPFSELEQSIIDWHDRGRPEDQKRDLADRAWMKVQSGEGNDTRARIFAGFVTSSGSYSGVDFEFVFDALIEAGADMRSVVIEANKLLNTPG